MAVTKQISDNGQEVVISISGKFDFNLVQEFRASYSEGDRYKRYTLSMERVEHIDSSALGMLLNMRKFLGGDMKIIIRNCKPSIKKILALPELVFLI